MAFVAASKERLGLTEPWQVSKDTYSHFASVEKKNVLPQTSHPPPHTIHPTPYTLHHTPYPTHAYNPSLNSGFN